MKYKWLWIILALFVFIGSVVKGDSIKDKRLANAEQSARIERRGLWADKNSIAPWDFRRGGKAS